MKLVDLGSLDFVPGLVCLINFFVAYLFFSQLTVHPIEDKIKASGGEMPKWDNVGFRVGSYCAALLTPIKVEQAQLVDENSLQKYATNCDRWRARYLMFSLVLFFLVAFLT